ncbi:MAG: hypothetical protein PHS30_07065 [Bacteroidales bacterium]|nr:hypothetical protein [Bacteroidales bacterium]
MDSENRLRHELAELNLLLQGLARIPSFPTELLELISGKVESVSLLALQPENQLLSIEPEKFPNALSNGEFEVIDRNSFDQDFEKRSDSAFFEVVTASNDASGQPEINASEDGFQQEQAAVESGLAEVVSTTRINDQMEQKRLVDLTRFLTLNDRFRFQREFFENNPQKMEEVFSAINMTQSVEEALDYLRGVCTVDEESDCYQDFCTMLHFHFEKISIVGRSN